VSGDTNGDTELDPGETWIYTATGTATAGQYENTATASGLDALERPVSDTDPSHYFGTTAPTPPTPTTPTPPPAATSTVRVVKNWVGARASTTIFVDRDGSTPYDASVLADSNGDATSFTLPVSSPATVGEAARLVGYTATIDCGSGPRAYSGGPFAVTSPAQAGATLTCTIVNTAAKPAPKPKPKPVLVITKVGSRVVVRSDQTVDFVVKIRNRGRGPATNVTVCDRLPDGLVFVRAPGARFVNGDACWKVARLSAGASKRYAVRVRPVRTATRKAFVNVATESSAAACLPRAKRAAARSTAVCSARARVVVLPSGAGVLGTGVTG
jgi:uncharacterized repeat protein (TIGR01451 family)